MVDRTAEPPKSCIAFNLTPLGQVATRIASESGSQRLLREDAETGEAMKIRRWARHRPPREITPFPALASNGVGVRPFDWIGRNIARKTCMTDPTPVSKLRRVIDRAWLIDDDTLAAQFEQQMMAVGPKLNLEVSLGRAQ